MRELDAAGLTAVTESAASLPGTWALLTTCDVGSETVNGVYADPIEAMCAADALERELRRAEPGAQWSVRLVPFVGACPASRPENSAAIA